jgi:DNA-binding NarL/FixJ family response regulator
MRILLADHHPQTLLALKTMLLEKAEFEVIGEAGHTADLLRLAGENPPDLALVDWELPGRPIEDVIQALHSLQPRPVVVLIGSKPETMRLMMDAGADASFSKVDQPAWLLETLQKYAKPSLPKKEI